MKHFEFSFFLLAASICVSAGTLESCKPSPAKAELAQGTVATDSIKFDQTVDSVVECSIAVDYPSGSDSLSMEVRSFVARELGGLYLPLVNGGDEAKNYAMYSGSNDNGKALVEYYGKGTIAYLKAQRKELADAGVKDAPGMSFMLSVRKTGDNTRYLTYASRTYSFLGGAHGSAVEYSTNISKLTGKVLEQSVDTLQAKAMQPLLRRGVVSYLRKQGEKDINEKNLGDYLFVENGFIPLPATPPYLAKDGVHFVYQQYEIGPYAMGIVSFTVPYAEITPYLTKEARMLVK